MPDLLSPSVIPESVEHSVLTLWHEWLSGFYDGGTHTIGGRPLVFPEAALSFQMTALQNPLNGVGIHLVWVQPPRMDRHWETIVSGQPIKEVSLLARWNVIVRARLENQPAPQAAKLAMDTASQLYLLLNMKSATLPLARKGITRIRAESPVLISDDSSGFAVRQIGVRGSVNHLLL